MAIVLLAHGERRLAARRRELPVGPPGAATSTRRGLGRCGSTGSSPRFSCSPRVDHLTLSFGRPRRW
jgi:hypothetical protein